MSVAPVLFTTIPPNGLTSDPGLSGGGVVNGDYFGSNPTSVAISADTSLIVGGAIGDGNSDTGAAYFFARATNTDNWNFIQRFRPPIPNTNALRFGTSVSITNNANVVAIGGPGALGGRVFLHAKNPFYNIWSYYQTLRGSDTATGNLFGNSVSFGDGGNYLAIGAPGASAAYIFDSNSTGLFSQQQKIATPTDIGSSATFGTSTRFSPDGNYLLIGAPGYDYPVNTNAGMVCMYKKDIGTDNWSLVQNISSPAIITSLGFGTTCDMSFDGTYAVVGGATVSSFFFKKTAGTDYWDCLQGFATSDTLGGGFLTSISYSGNAIAIGNKRLATSDKGGVVYFQKRADTDIWLPLSTIRNNDQPSFTQQFQGSGGMLSADGSYIVFGAGGYISDRGNVFISFRDWVKQIPSTNTLSLIGLLSSPRNTVVLPKASETTNAMTWLKDTTPWRQYYSLLTISTTGGDRIDGLYSTISFCNAGMSFHFAQDKQSNWYTLNYFDEKY